MPRKSAAKVAADAEDLGPDLSDIPRRSTRISQPANKPAVVHPKKSKAATAKKATTAKKRRHDDEEGDELVEDPEAKKAKVDSEDVPKLSPIDLGDSLPTLTLKNEKDEDVEISTLAAEKGVVLFLVPKADTPGCTTQACGFRDIYPDITSSNFDVYCLSADTTAAQTKWQTKKSLPYPLLSDRKRILINALTGSATKTPRSHFIFERGGILVDKKIPVKPADSSKLALEFIKGSNQSPAAKA